MIISLVLVGAFLQALLALSRGISDFAAIRIAQTGVIAGVLPLIISIFAADSGGDVIGFLNSSRFAGAAVGPILATSILAHSGVTALHGALSGLSVLSLIGFLIAFRNRSGERKPSYSA